MLPVHGPEGPIRTVVGTEGAPAAVRAVLFDFSGTLFQIGTYAERIRSALARPVDDATMDALLGGLETGLSEHRVVAAQQGRDVSAEAHRRAFTTWYASVPELAPVADVLYEQLRTPEHWVPYADSESVLRRLTQAGVSLGLVSDVGWDLQATFARHGLDHYVTSWVHSFEFGTEKPDPRLFQRACAELGVSPAETLMVGDHPGKDGGAVHAGLRAHLLPAGSAPGQTRGLNAVLRLAGLAPGAP